jgi:Uma2 family endonuclease
MNLAVPDSELPVRLRFQSPVSDEDLVRFCAENEAVRVEIDSNGELIVMAPVGYEGAGAENDVAVELTLWARQDGTGRAFGANAGFRLQDGSLRMADAAWVSWRRAGALTAQERKGFPPICPEFVIEVRSETDRLMPLREKMGIWIANGAELGWLIDPERRVVEVYRPGEAVETHDDPTSVQGTGCVRGFELVMARIWG